MRRSPPPLQHEVTTRWAGWGARPADGAAPKVAPTWSDESDSEESDTEFVIVDPQFCVQHGGIHREPLERDGVVIRLDIYGALHSSGFKHQRWILL